MEENIETTQTTEEQVDKKYSEDDLKDAINKALADEKAKHNKTDSQRIQELEAQIKARDEKDYCTKALTDANIPLDLIDLFIGEKDSVDKKVETFNKVLETLIEKEVTNKLKDTKAISLKNSEIGNQKNKLLSLDEIAKKYN